MEKNYKNLIREKVLNWCATFPTPSFLRFSILDDLDAAVRMSKSDEGKCQKWVNIQARKMKKGKESTSKKEKENGSKLKSNWKASYKLLTDDKEKECHKFIGG